MPYLYDYAAPDAVPDGIRAAKYRAQQVMENVRAEPSPSPPSADESSFLPPPIAVITQPPTPFVSFTESACTIPAHLLPQQISASESSDFQPVRHSRWSSQSSGKSFPDVPPPVVPTYAQPVDHATAYQVYMQLDASRFPPGLAIPDHILRSALPPVSPSCVDPNAQPVDCALRSTPVRPVARPIEILGWQTPLPRYSGSFSLDGDLPDAAGFGSTAVVAGDRDAQDVHSALSHWYSEEILKLLVRPGYYRPGVGGAADEIWGPGGREKDAWARIGRVPPMGMSQAPVPPPRPVHVRNPAAEETDPWYIAWRHRIRPDPDFVYFVSNALIRMTVSPTAVVAALWYLRGLGLHPGDGDGDKGHDIRAVLSRQSMRGNGGVERRVAVLGLLLAGKWLDDNSYLRKSWTEVTKIPLEDIERLEIAALKDLHFSLHLPLPAWTKHLHEQYCALIAKPMATDFDNLVLRVLHAMATEAQAYTSYENKPSNHRVIETQRRSSTELPAAGDQAISRAWGEFAQNYAIDGYGQAPAVPSAHGPDYSTSASLRKTLLPDVYDDVVLDEEEEFVEYDGAKPFPVPETLKVGRSASGSSSRSRDRSGLLGEQSALYPPGVTRYREMSTWNPASSSKDFPKAGPQSRWSQAPVAPEYSFFNTSYPVAAPQPAYHYRWGVTPN